MEEKLKTLLQDEEFAKKLFNLEIDTEIQSFLAENGVEFSLEEIAAIKAGVKASLENEDEELSDDMLENVAGGASKEAQAIEVIKDVFNQFWDGFADAMRRW